MKMFYKKANCIVTVYNFFENGSALIFSPMLAGKQNGNGWERVKLSQLIPIEYFDEDKHGFTSTSEKNKIKKRLVLSYAEWKCSDDAVFTDCNQAIEHERNLMEMEKENTTVAEQE